MPSLSNTNFTPIPMYSVTLKRSQWECYRDTPDSIIETINGFFSRILADCDTPIDAQSKIYGFLSFYKEWGFSDSECNQAATDEVNKYYKSNIDRWECMKASWGVTV